MRNNVYKGQPMVKNISVFPVALPDIDVLKNESATPAALGEQYKADMQRLDVPQHSLGHYIPGFDTASSGVERLDESDAKSGVQSNASPPKSTRAPVTSHSPSPAHKTLSAPSFPGPAPVPAPGVLDQTQSDGQNNLKRKFATSKTDYQPSKKFKTGQTNAVSDPASSAVGGAPNTPLAKGDTGITGQLNGLQTNATAGASKPSRWDQKPAYTAHSHSCNH
ncbi:hypothetical protein HII31_06083 [Pseudocercospora fuligena]|uniref:Uncharacterized protein n=1 Tax=Pseudocercospora fuligena TaxID=685502 RepID=A0A8H6RKA3_9PEZI|nr:hypothetical protein HII31_06083 [Pseudocercospora fuligena]